MNSNNSLTPTTITLTQAAYYARKAILYGSIGFIIMAFITYGVRKYNEYKLLHPPKVVQKPNYLFGRLPDLVFPTSNEIRPNVKLELSTGYFPETPEVIKVVKKKTVKLVGFEPVETARIFARKLGFDQRETKENEEYYTFSHKVNLFQKIRINVLTGAFEILYDIKGDSSLMLNQSLPQGYMAIADCRHFFESADSWSPELSEDNAQTEYFQISPEGDLISTIYPFEANLIKVAFNRLPILEQQVFTSDPKTGVASCFFSGKNGSQTNLPLKAEFNFFPVDSTQVGTYFSKSPLEAWNEFEKGGGWIVNPQNIVDNSVRRVYLGFYDDLASDGYLLPIWVFEGDKDFRVFVPAVLPK